MHEFKSFAEGRLVTEINKAKKFAKQLASEVIDALASIASIASIAGKTKLLLT